MSNIDSKTLFRVLVTLLQPKKEDSGDTKDKLVSFLGFQGMQRIETKITLFLAIILIKHIYKFFKAESLL